MAPEAPAKKMIFGAAGAGKWQKTAPKAPDFSKNDPPNPDFLGSHAQHLLCQKPGVQHCRSPGGTADTPVAQSGGAGDPPAATGEGYSPGPPLRILGEAPGGSLTQPHPHGNAACHQASAFEGVDPNVVRRTARVRYPLRSIRVFLFFLLLVCQRGRPSPQAPGLAQRWTTGMLSTRGVLSSASVAAPASQAPSPRLSVLGHFIAFSGVPKEQGAESAQLKRVKIRHNHVSRKAHWHGLRSSGTFRQFHCVHTGGGVRVNPDHLEDLPFRPVSPTRTQTLATKLAVSPTQT
eukprot:gene21021-biopygen16155